ncbi:MAG: TlpA disulfide reductase family protein [Planctomycetota bacterium]|nr:TlpA disulfide reductase family protein [Planctomycetota bacterium]
MTWLPLFRRLSVFVLLLAGCILLLQPVSAETRLSIGSDAPALDISDWLHKSVPGAKAPVTKFEKGKIYVVEFWATWCGPCIQSMPHLAMLQKKFADKDVQIISVTDEDIPTVQEFLAREAKGKDGNVMTFNELTQAYSLTADPDGSTHNDYTAAAKLNGIPVAFIVGKDSIVEWIGHPGQMDEPLQQVVDGSWDRKVFAVEYEDEKRLESLQEAISMRIESANGKELSPKLVSSILSTVDAFVKETKTPRVLKQAKFMQLELRLQFMPNDDLTLASYESVAEFFETRPLELNGLNWGIFELVSNGHIKNRKFSEALLSSTQKLVDKVPANQVGTVYDTISHLQHFLGDLDSALKSAKLAAAAPDASPDIQAFVSKLEAELAEKQAPK